MQVDFHTKNNCKSYFILQHFYLLNKLTKEAKLNCLSMILLCFSSIFTDSCLLIKCNMTSSFNFPTPEHWLGFVGFVLHVSSIFLNLLINSLKLKSREDPCVFVLFKLSTEMFCATWLLSCVSFFCAHFVIFLIFFNLFALICYWLSSFASSIPSYPLLLLFLVDYSRLFVWILVVFFFSNFPFCSCFVYWILFLYHYWNK